MEDLNNFIVVSSENFNSCGLFEEYDEKLEAEFIMRARSIFDEFVCPRTGVIMISTFGELLNGINRLWALTQEMKGFTQEIHERLINLPLLFILSLLRLIEKEYCLEDYEKTPADPQLSETLLNTFMQLHKKLGYFKRYYSQKILLNTCLMYLRHLLMITGLDKSIKKVKWTELSVSRVKVDCPIRETDMSLFVDSLRYFRSEILPVYSKRPTPYILLFRNRFPEIMEPTLEVQKEAANFIIILSAWMFFFSILLLGISTFVNSLNQPSKEEIIPNIIKLNQQNPITNTNTNTNTINNPPTPNPPIPQTKTTSEKKTKGKKEK